MTATGSPVLTEIDRLFAEDPLKLNDSDVLRIVQHYRDNAKSWAISEAAGATRPRPKAIEGDTDDILRGLGVLK